MSHWDSATPRLTRASRCGPGTWGICNELELRTPTAVLGPTISKNLSYDRAVSSSSYFESAGASIGRLKIMRLHAAVRVLLGLGCKRCAGSDSGIDSLDAAVPYTHAHTCTGTAVRFEVLCSNPSVHLSACSQKKFKVRMARICGSEAIRVQVYRYVMNEVQRYVQLRRSCIRTVVEREDRLLDEYMRSYQECRVSGIKSGAQLDRHLHTCHCQCGEQRLDQIRDK